MRPTLALILLVALGCGLGRPAAVVVDRPVLHAELMGGDVTEDSDRGASGEFTVETGSSAQSLAWAPIDPSETIDDRADMLRQMAQRMMDADPELRGTLDGLVGTSVAGTAAVGFRGRVSIGEVRVTVWRCEEAGVQVSLTTTGIVGSSRHDDALRSVRCGQAPAALRPKAPSWKVTPPGEGWSAERDEEGDETWRGLEGEMLVVTGTLGLLADDEDAMMCRVAVDALLEKVGGWVELTATPTPAAQLDDGCRATFAGRLTELGSEVAGVARVQGCPLGEFTTLCLVPGATPESAVAACAGWVGCL